MKNILILFIVTLFLSTSCKKKEVGPQRIDGSSYYKELGQKVVIGCEGNFGWGNASLSVYNSLSKTVSNNVFQSQNGIALGDVLQSTTLFDGKLFVTVNNSNAVKVLDTSNFISLGAITGLNSPRYFLGISPSKAYVSDLYSNKITIVNPTTFQVTGEINTGGWTEKMVLFDNLVFVTKKATNQVLIIDKVTNLITDSITVGKEPNSLVMDSQNNLWVLCSGGINESTPQLLKIDAFNYSILSTFNFPSISESPTSLAVDSSRTNLFYLNNGVFKHSVGSSSLSSTAFIANGNAIFYGLGINPFNNDIYVADAIDYVQAGKVSRFSKEGTEIESFSTGIIPQDFTFIGE